MTVRVGRGTKCVAVGWGLRGFRVFRGYHYTGGRSLATPGLRSPMRPPNSHGIHGIHGKHGPPRPFPRLCFPHRAPRIRNCLQGKVGDGRGTSVQGWVGFPWIPWLSLCRRAQSIHPGLAPGVCAIVTDPNKARPAFSQSFTVLAHRSMGFGVGEVAGARNVEYNLHQTGDARRCPIRSGGTERTPEMGRPIRYVTSQRQRPR